MFQLQHVLYENMLLSQLQQTKQFPACIANDMVTGWKWNGLLVYITVVITEVSKLTSISTPDVFLPSWWAAYNIDRTSEPCRVQNSKLIHTVHYKYIHTDYTDSPSVLLDTRKSIHQSPNVLLLTQSNLSNLQNTGQLNKNRNRHIHMECTICVKTNCV